VYRASTVVEALRNNETLSVTGLDTVICPADYCGVVPERCDMGLKQSCKKQVAVGYEHDGHNKEVRLVFYFQHKEITREGFIKKNDLALGILLKRNIIKL